MLELRHSPWCEGLDCEDTLEEPLAGDSAGNEDPEESQQDGSGSLEDTISSSLQLVLPSDFAPSRVNSKIWPTHKSKAACALALHPVALPRC